MDANTSLTIDPESMYNYINNLLINPTAFIILVFVIIVYIILFVNLGDSSASTNGYNTSSSVNSGLDSTSSFFIIVIVAILIIIILFNALQFIFNIDIMASINNLFTPQKQLDIKINENSKLYSPINDISLNPVNIKNEIIGKQVFNIPGNHYKYDDAKTLCKAFDSRLATYEEVERAYVDGGEWCNYGWSDGQMALFPTQKNTFNNLQKIKGHEHDCGRPGVNGGYIANPNIKYGVNCFGYKPKITSEEEEMMRNTTPYPKTEKDIAMEKQVDFWKTKIDDILLSPFNYSNWSKI
jgi:hypothetical protein